MKKVIVIFFIAGMGMLTTSCFQRSCPTYAKQNIKAPVENTVEISSQEKI